MDDFQVFNFQSHDFDEISESLARWDQTYHQLSAGFFHGEVKYVLTNGVEIFELDWGQVIHYQGLTPPGTIGFGLPLSLSGEARYLNRAVSNNELLIQHSGSEGDLIGSQNFKIHVLTISEQHFLDKLQTMAGVDSCQQLQHVNTIKMTSLVANTLRYKFQNLVLKASSDASTNNNSPIIIGQLANNLVESIASLVISAGRESVRLRWIRQRQLVKKAEEYIWSHPTVPPRSAVLCTELGTSERSLRDAFKACTGMSASAYLKVLRLNQVRAILKSSAPDQFLVQDVAFGWGFSHMGQFAADYKALFGEGPSETLHNGRMCGETASWQHTFA